MDASGKRYSLHSGSYAAEVVQVGATLRTLSFDDRQLILPFDPDQLRPHMRGAIMQPWPGRIPDGRYSFAGSEHQLPWNEPERANALHGLVSWLPFERVSQAADRIRLGALLAPQQGYPFALRCEVAYRVSADGLDVEVAATNVGNRPAPYGAANHPYLVPGAGSVDDWTLTLAADTVSGASLPRYQALHPVPVAGSDADFRTGRRIGDQRLNHTYGGLGRRPDGWAEARVTAADGGGVVLRCDRAADWLQVFSYDLPTTEARSGLAIEPLTCALNAFNTGVGLVSLAPGERHSYSMKIAAVAPNHG